MPPTTSSLFNNPDADVILRSVDEVDFHIDLAILSAASSVFKDMSALPLPASEETKDGRNIVSMQEISTTLEYLLQLIHPAMHPSLRNATLDTFTDILAAADKYQMSKIAPALEDALDNARFFTEPALERISRVRDSQPIWHARVARWLRSHYPVNFSKSLPN